MDSRLVLLRAALRKLRTSYPKGMRPIPDDELDEIAGRAFFPAGSGLFLGRDQVLAKRPILILGNDFGLYEDYLNCVRLGAEPMNRTWTGLIRAKGLLTMANIDPKTCFFSNVVLGAWEGGKGEGQSPGLKNAAFRELCGEFVKTQIRILHPCAVVMLGKEQAAVIASVIPSLEGLAVDMKWSEIDQEKLQFRASALLDGEPASNAFGFCAVMHSCRRGNVKSVGRHLVHPANGRVLTDYDAETAMMRLVAGLE